MIVNRVSALLGERRASIQDLARDAGLAYGTAFALYHDKAARYDRDTLNKLCRYFGCGVGELLVYRPDGTSAHDEPGGQPAADRVS
jgi:putative transcriptional regulator